MSQHEPKGRTAGPDRQLIKLEEDPQFVHRQQRERELRRQQLIREYREAAAPVLADLARAGIEADSIDELYNRALNYRPAIPVLLHWLHRVQNDDVKEDIARALTVRWAKPSGARPLIEEFRKAQDPQGTGLKWAMGNALSEVADDSVFDQIVELVRDKRHGRAREMLALALGNMRNPKAVDILVELLDDEEMAGHAVMGLGKLKAKRAKPHIERFLSHPKAWIRREAKRALAKIDRAEQARSGRESSRSKDPS